MDKNMELLWAKLEDRLNHKPLTITTAVTTNVMEAINDKMEDYPKHILEIQKKLQPKVEEERKKGNLAYIKHDKLIVKQLNDLGPEKRKREQIGSPNSPKHKRSNPNKTRISSAT
ncbi:hypothetical protein WA026_021120 [Henosepilachna vigintioctopunctata]|uniref:Uncharacterized protein n=1 Tax=Henosepilachna vigintioctopunctata TaxID=420089 RepID=A0AAW1V3A2_9CUCU